MSDHPEDETSPSERLMALELKAQAIRSRLARVVDTLDARRHRAVAVGTYLRSGARPVAFAILGAVVIVGASALAVRSLLRQRRRRRLPALASRAMRRLDLQPKPSFAIRILEKAALSLATMTATELVAMLTKRFAVSPRSLGPRVA